MNFRWFAVLILVTGFSFSAQAQPEPRILAAFYDNNQSSNPRPTSIHRFLEMPANHLGFDIRYYDINAPLPQLGDETKAIVLWFTPGNSVPDAAAFLNWLEAQTANGRKLLIFENAGIGDKQRQKDSVMQQYNRILSKLGIQDANQWNSVTYRTNVEYMDPILAGFERRIGPVLPPFGDTRVIPGRAKSYLKMTVRTKEEEETVDLITTNEHGGYVAEGYALFEVVEDDESKIVQWFINPFVFLQRALDTGVMPIPDITTLNGRRIFYSHIDGDGWNNLCEIEKYMNQKTIVADVVRKEILEPYKDFAFTVGPIVSDLDPQCYGLPGSAQAARDMFALLNVEPSSHTHSHPLFWRYFANYTPEKEEPLLKRYPEKPKNKTSMMEDIKDKTLMTDWKHTGASDNAPHVLSQPSLKPTDDPQEMDFTDTSHKRVYDTPRSYACSPFSLDQEIKGSIDYINKLTPPNKKATLIQWSGDTSPYVDALKATREAGYYNINGGDSRFDNEYPSYASVAPIGLHLGNELQIYSSNSNENTYTQLWTGRFFGFRYLQKTVENTENPIRVRPFNLYFHMYSGQKQASLAALRENLDYARSQKLIPITTTQYAAIANGFYTMQYTKLGEMEWKIQNRGTVDTIRFDNASGLSVDFSASKGVWGQNYLHDSLYIALDPNTQEPIVKLKNNSAPNMLPIEFVPYLLDSRWQIKVLQNNKNSLTIRALGYGKGEMTWIMPESGSYLITAKQNGQAKPLFETTAVTAENNQLHFTVDIMSPTELLEVTIQKK